ncbi:hypothetical protein SADUNF_Sadunf05G0052500 [Salix dunnii]|uniref:Uncharacterized protein n=1 Tax=Salix dunnii TaxID=1413687 RepID=A0A835K9Q1_9ROSI|nr:hypothetical protein SADUNF_Sadunf05G0052500 [Salix dunnii]
MTSKLVLWSTHGETERKKIHGGNMSLSSYRAYLLSKLKRVGENDRDLTTDSVVFTFSGKSVHPLSLLSVRYT